MNSAKLKETIANIVKEESEYQVFFRKALEKAGKSITDMSDEEKKAFFNKIDATWDSKGEKNEGNAFGAAVVAAKKAGEDEFEVGGKTFKVEESTIESVVTEGAGTEAMGIAAFTGTRGDAVQKFIDDNKLDGKKLFNYVKVGKLKERMDFVTALVGNPGNKIQKMIISKFGIKESVNEAANSKGYKPKNDFGARIVQAIDTNIKEANPKYLKKDGVDNAKILEYGKSFFDVVRNGIKAAFKFNYKIHPDVEFPMRRPKGNYFWFDSKEDMEKYLKKFLSDLKKLDAMIVNYQKKPTLKVQQEICDFWNFEVMVGSSQTGAMGPGIARSDRSGQSMYESVNEEMGAPVSKTKIVNVKLASGADMGTRPASALGMIGTVNIGGKKYQVKAFRGKHGPIYTLIGHEKFNQNTGMPNWKYFMDKLQGLNGGKKVMFTPANDVKIGESVNEAKVFVHNEKTGEKYEVLSGKGKGDLLIAMKALEKSAPSHMKYSIKESVNEDVSFKDGKYHFYSKSGAAYLTYNGQKLSHGDFDRGADGYFMSHSSFSGQKFFEDGNAVIAYFKKNRIVREFVKNESVNEGVSSTDMDKIKGAVEAASSFMSVGSELKKLGMKYTFATEPLPIYIIQPTPNNKVAIVNKKYASKPDFVVGDIAVGIMEGKLNEEEIKWNAVENAIINFLKMNTKILDKRVQAKDTDGVKGGLSSIIRGLTNAQRNLKLESVNETSVRAGLKLRTYLNGRSDIVDYELVKPNYYNAVKGGKTNLFKVINSTHSKIKVGSTEDFSTNDVKAQLKAGVMTVLKESVNEGRAFINAARKAKLEGKTEFEFNGKKYPVTLKEGTLNEDPNMNKKVKALLDKELKDLSKGRPNHLFAVMHILMGALTDANFHSESKKVPTLFGSKAKYEGDPMAEKDLIQMYQYDLGTDVANICKWDGKDIVNAVGFYVSMTIGRPMGEKIENLIV
jgi:hypothetical protein